MNFLRQACCLIALLLAAGAAFAQDTATFTCTVRDTSCAVVASADVVVANATIGVERATVSNNDGEWVVTALPIGAYNITVSAKGFKKFQANGVVIRVGQKLRVDVNLEVGSPAGKGVVSGKNSAQAKANTAEN